MDDNPGYNLGREYARERRLHPGKYIGDKPHEIARAAGQYLRSDLRSRFEVEFITGYQVELSRY